MLYSGSSTTYLKKGAFSQFWHFLAHMTRTRFFHNMQFSPKVPYYLVSTFSIKKAHINELDFRQNTKKNDFGPIWTDFFFLKNPALSHFLLYCPLTCCKKQKKLLDSFQDKKNKTDQRTILESPEHARI